MSWKAVDALLDRHEWRLLDRAEFARRALDQLRRSVARDAQRAATFVYSQALHAACSGAEGLERQNRAYTELFGYLYESALHRYADMGEEVSQRAIASTFADFKRCRQPGAFLAFAIQHMLDAARSLRREQQPRTRAVPAGEHERALGDQIADERQPDPAEALIAGELHAGFEQLAEEFLRKHPRAARQFAALRLKYIDGLDDVTIGAQLGVPVKSVYVLRTRAIEKLRAEPAWRALAAEFGILPGE
ncbi:MAG: RNA polymerase sigma factor [Roseiflexaceae bacterium]